MSALALAMLLTGAGAVQPAKPPPRPVPYPQPPVIAAPRPPPPPLPSRSGLLERGRANLASYFSSDDYPPSALRAQEQGTVGFRLSIGVGGRVTDCLVTATSGSASLDAATCRILRGRARYRPARGADGLPVAGSDSGRVTWRLPDPDAVRAGIPVPAARAVPRVQVQDLFAAGDYPVSALRAREAGRSIVRLVVGTTGRVIACDVVLGSGSVALDAAACRILRARARYTPARAEAGAAACDVFFGPVEWVLPPPRRRLPRDGPLAVAPPPIDDQLAPGACPDRRVGRPPPIRYAPPVSPPPPPVSTRPPQRARANLNTYFSPDDYPAAALRAFEQGTVGFALSIGPNGRVHECIVTVTSGSAALDQATCRILRARARYTPARDFYGDPTFGRDSGRVSWRLPTNYTGPERFGIPTPDAYAVMRRSLGDLVVPGDYPAAGAGAAGASMIRVVVGPDGRVIACDVARGSGSAALDAAACRIVRARARYTPARDAYGTAVCDLDAGWIDWRPPPRRPRARPSPPATAPPPLSSQLRPGLCPGWQP